MLIWMPLKPFLWKFEVDATCSIPTILIGNRFLMTRW